MQRLLLLALAIPVAIVWFILREKFPNSLWVRVTGSVVTFLVGAAAILQLVPEEIFKLNSLTTREATVVFAGLPTPRPPDPTASPAKPYGRGPSPSPDSSSPYGASGGESDDDDEPPGSKSPSVIFPRRHYAQRLIDPDDDPGWPVMGRKGDSAGYDGQGYAIYASHEYGPKVTYAMKAGDHFALQVDVTPLSPSGVVSYAIGFGPLPADKVYMFLVADEYCALVMMENDSEQDIVAREYDCPALRQGVANRLKLIVDGKDFQAAIDGEVVLEKEMDISPGGEGVFLVVYTRQEGTPAGARFNDLSVWLPPEP